MKVLVSPTRPYRLSVANAPGRVVVDRKFASRLNLLNWKWVPAAKRARAQLGKKQGREFLHRYIANHLAKKGWAEVFLVDGDPLNCLLSNLRPYEREEQGAARGQFKNNTTGKRGVYFKKSSGRWYATIRARGRLKHLGYFSDANAAAKAYATAYRLRHPKLKLRF